MFNVALIGHGYWGSKLERYIKENSNFKLKYICDSKCNLNEVWYDKDVSAVIIAVRNEQRYQITKDALINNKHVLSEKPLSMTTAQANILKNLSVENNLILTTDYTFTFSKAIKIALEKIKSKSIGKLLGMDMIVKHIAPFGNGSVYWVLGSHMLSILDMFVPIKELSFSKQDIVTYDNEVETGIINFQKQDFKGQIHLSLNYPSKQVEIVFYGENGTIVYNPKEFQSLIIQYYKRVAKLREENLPKSQQKLSIDESNNLKYTIEHFHNVLIGKEQSNLETAVEITRILEEL